MEQLSSLIINYFNGPLKASLVYRDTFTRGNIYGNTFILLSNCDIKNQKCLSNKISQDKDLLVKITDILKRGIIKKNNLIRDILILPEKNSIIIEIIPQSHLINLDNKDILYTIFMYLNKEELDNLSKSDLYFENLYKTNDFWAGLFRTKYPGYNYKILSDLFDEKKIDFKTLYLGLLKYEQMIEKLESEFTSMRSTTSRLSPQFPSSKDIDFIKQDKMMELINNAIRKLSEDVIIFLIYINKISQEDLPVDLFTIIKYTSIKTIKFIHKKYPEIFNKEILQEIIDYIHDNEVEIDSYDKFIWANELLGNVVSNKLLLQQINADNHDFSEKIIEQLPNEPDETFSINDVYDLILDQLGENNNVILHELFQKYKIFFTSNQILSLLERLLIQTR